MNGERVIHQGGQPAPIVLDITCSHCWIVYRYVELPITTVLAQLMADEGWTFSGMRQLCANCTKPPVTSGVDIQPTESI